MLWSLSNLRPRNYATARSPLSLPTAPQRQLCVATMKFAVFGHSFWKTRSNTYIGKRPCSTLRAIITAMGISLPVLATFIIFSRDVTDTLHGRSKSPVRQRMVLLTPAHQHLFMALSDSRWGEQVSAPQSL